MDKKKFSERFRSIREACGKTQVGLAAYLDVGQSTVSGWETGEGTPPSPEAWAKLGNIAPYPDNIFCWEQAGIERDAILRAAEELLRERAAPLAESEFFHFGPDRLSARLVRNPGRTRHLVLVAESAPHGVHPGDYSSHGLRPGDIVLFDESEKDAQDLELFWGQIVLAEFDDPPREHHLYMGLLDEEGLEDSSPFRLQALLWVPGRATGFPIGQAPPGVKGKKGRAEIQLFPHWRVLGIVVAWLRPPRAGKL